MHLSREQVAELVAPHPDTLERVYSWLKYNGVSPSSISISHGNSWLTVAEVPMSQANKLLGASYELYYHAWANATILRTVSYALPAALHMHVKTVAPTTAFTSTRLLQKTQLSHSDGEAAPANATSGEPSDMLPRGEKSYIMPQFLRWLYSMPFNNPDPTDRNKLGIAGFANQFPDTKDLYKFIGRYRSDLDPETASTRILTTLSVNGGVDGVEDGTVSGRRANLDTQYSVALTYPTQIEYYTIGGVQETKPDGTPMDGDQYVEWLRYMISMPNVPLTISVPYFTRELDLPKEYVKSLCNLFEVLGARGVSILVASGDEGVGRGLWDRMKYGVPFSASFPASCACDVYYLIARSTHALAPGLGTSCSLNRHHFTGPCVTSVGGTTGFNPEIGSQTSGGGFSNYFDRPDYQKDAVIPFLVNLGSQHVGLYKCVRSRSLTKPILTITSAQPSGSWCP